MSIPEIVVFEHAHFGGRSFRTNLNISSIRNATMEHFPTGITQVAGIPQLFFSSWDMNDGISSIIVISGIWQFFLHDDFIGKVGPDLKVGYHPYVEWKNIPNDQISSFKCIPNT